ncbi:hypothetical protein FUSNEC_GEN_298_03655 [Fusobacterium necrophorum subsp. funduliforme]|nr:hypothetical protein [Fusobacterium necrophorum]MBR8789342.1 hypothetical protein [Fusobacterium necrophorum]
MTKIGVLMFVLAVIGVAAHFWNKKHNERKGGKK